MTAYEEAIGSYQRIGDTAAEATARFNLGRAYMELPAIRDLDAAEASYRHELSMLNPNDLSGRAVTTQQIGMVHHARFNDARSNGEPADAVRHHAEVAKQHYQQALALCPPSAVTDLAPMHGQFGNLYQSIGQIEPAREQYEQATQYFEQSGNRYSAGGTRCNVALMYCNAASREAAAARRRDLLHRALAYAQASLRDFQHYQGRAADMEARVQQLIDDITQALGE